MIGATVSHQTTYLGNNYQKLTRFYRLKIKQRQKEYWKKRIRRDFSPSLEQKKRKKRYEADGFGDKLDSIEEAESTKGLLKLKKLDT